MSNKFNFYEIVEIYSMDKAFSKINGKKGVVLGMSQNDDNSWGYAVCFDEETWDLSEEILTSTGQFSSRDQFYSDSDEDKVKIIVDENGEGKIKDE